MNENYNCALNVIMQALYLIPNVENYVHNMPHIINFLKQMDETKKIISPKDLLADLHFEPNSFLDQYFDPLFEQIDEVGIQTECRYLQRSSNSLDVIKERRKITIFDVNTEQLDKALKVILKENEFPWLEHKITHMGEVLFFKNQRGMHEFDFEFPQMVSIAGFVYKLRAVINFIPGVINHFTILAMLGNGVNVLIDDTRLKEGEQEKDKTFIGMYLRAEKEIGNGLIQFLKKPAPRYDSEISADFKRNNPIFKNAFSESFMVKPIMFHNEEIEDIISNLYYLK